MGSASVERHPSEANRLRLRQDLTSRRVPAARTEQFNSATWLVDRHVDEGRSDRIAIRCQGRSTTYGELQQQLWRAQHLLAELGLSAGDRLAMVVQDDEVFPALFLGAQRSGIVAVPVSTMLNGTELASVIADSGARALAISHRFASAVPDIVAGAPNLESVVVDGDPATTTDAVGRSVDVRSWADATNVDEAATAETTKESQAFWLYSSGTTGNPKGVIHLHGSLQATVTTYASEVLQVDPPDRFLSVAKLFFAFGLGNSLTFPFAVGATAILNPDPLAPRLMAELIEAESATLFFASPGFCAAMLDAGVEPSTFETVRATVTAGESLPANVHTRFTKLTNKAVLDGFGTTELLHIFISNTMNDQVPGTSGRVVTGYEAQLRDDDGNIISGPDSPGYLHVRGPSTAVGYWQRPEATEAAFRDGWVRTGDVYTCSNDDRWSFLGRNNDMIKAGGIWVSPAEVENVLSEHGSVLEAAVVGARDAQGLETVVAFVLPASGSRIDLDELQQHCRSRMAAFKRPRRIEVVDELPKTATGKIKRFVLRDSVSDPVDL
ncbi:MAG: benzoate-CoA ligase family protein [Actinomycetia bacterium]|nr:benzoate-CoA ligase family protein [Actinomycetes bacterium]